MTSPDEGTIEQQTKMDVTAKVNTAEIISEWEEKVDRARTIETEVLFGAHTDLGRIRENNEDKFEFFVPEDTETLARKGSLFAVADGMGGHAAGQIASEIALKTLVDHYYSDASPLIEESLKAALKKANGIVYDLSRAVAQRQGMGTTVTLLVIRGDDAYIAHVGDSRCYRIRDSKIEQLSDDHSWVNEQVKLGSLTQEQALLSPFRNRITRSIGNFPSVDVDIFSLEAKQGDIYILCSDGLSGELTDSEILEIAEKRACSQVAWNLVNQAVEKGGRDNTTAVVVAIRKLTSDKPVRKKGFLSFLSQ